MNPTTTSDASKIAVVGLTYPYRGGISHYSSLFVRNLRLKYDVQFLTLCRQYPQFLFPGVSQFDSSDKNLMEANESVIDSINPVSWLRTARILNDADPALIVIQWWHPFFSFSFGSIVRLLRKDLRERVCFLCHNVLPHEGSPLQSILTKYAFRPAKYFIVHSSQDHQQLKELHPTALIRQGVHPTYAEFATMAPSTREEARRKLNIRDNENVLLFFGLIRRYKGLSVLIDAMDKLSGRLDCRLVVAGEFYDDKEKYLEQIRRLGLEDRIRVVDEYIANEEVADYFLAANVVVLPYITATQSGIVQIAFGLGAPVITTNVGGLPEAVADGETGYIVPPQDSEALSNAILRFFDEDCEDQFRSAIHAEAEKFSWDQEISFVDGFLADAAAPPAQKC